MPTSAPALSLEAVSVSYGHVRAVTEVSFAVPAGQVVALLGPNGAGKSTLLRAVVNQVGKDGGRVRLHGEDVSSTATHRLARRGVVLVPEGRQVIGPLTVHENLLVAGGATRRRSRSTLAGDCARVYDLFPPLQRLRDRPSALLSGGEQQMLAIGRALVVQPRILLLDEPSMGLAPVMVEAIYGFLADHRGTLDNTAVLLAEQSRSALSVAGEVVVLSRGRTVHVGPVASLGEDVLTHAYLGAGTPRPIDPAAATADLGGAAR
jgi:branched-chain amino acid transport system ATP-binding protein